MTVDPSTTVHVGKDGYLFLAGGQHGVFSYFSGKRKPVAGSVETFYRNARDRAAFCRKTGREFRMIVFPEKCVALRDHVDLDLELVSLFEHGYRSDKLSEESEVLYPLDVLEFRKDAFLRTDTHYSGRGNMAMTQALTADLFPGAQETFTQRCLSILTEKAGFSGDLGRKFTPPRTEVNEGFAGRPTPIRMADNGVTGGNDGIMDLVESPEALSDKTVMIFGDSFFRQILPLLAVFYRRIIFCRSRFFHYEMIEAFAPDHVFCGCAERYLSNSTADAHRPHFLSYPQVLGRPQAPGEEFCTLWERFVDRSALLSGAPS